VALERERRLARPRRSLSTGYALLYPDPCVLQQTDEDRESRLRHRAIRMQARTSSPLVPCA